MIVKYSSAVLLGLALSLPSFAATQTIDLNQLLTILQGAESDAEEDGDYSKVSDEQNSLESSIIKIMVTSKDYDFSSPWNAPEKKAGSGSGFVVSIGNKLYIMTNAHVVADGAFIQVLKPHTSKKFNAQVSFIGHECDLAVLTVENSSDFFEGIEPLEFGEISKNQKITVYGYPAGGESLSVTRGLSGRTEVQDYVHSGTELLLTQTDAPINPGNSGGPVLDRNDMVVGVAFQGTDDLQNTAYFIPTPVIEHFVKEVENGDYRGFPVLGVTFQELQNPALRRMHKIPDDQSGMLVAGIAPTSPAKGALQIGDVVLSLNGTHVDNDLKYDFPGKLRISYEHIVRSSFMDDTLQLKTLRDGEELDIELKLTADRKTTELVEKFNYDQKPTYYIYGGCVFQPLVGGCLTGNISLDMLGYLNKEKKEADQEIVILSQVLQAEANEGYESFDGEVVKEVNGVEVKNLKHMIELLKQNEGLFQKILLLNKRLIVLDRDVAERDGPDILTRYDIPAAQSENL
ncbi:MAG: trypsin-like peptidase domain-containing protein [Oligoflexales bacterium]